MTIKRWTNQQNLLHRDDDLPAVEYSDGSKQWYKNGLIHRDGGLPALVWEDGYKEWWVGGQRHRDGGLPAVEYLDGTKEWWENGLILSKGQRSLAPRPRQLSFKWM